MLLWRGKSPYNNYYIWIDPRAVKRKSRMPSNKYRDTGKVIGGNWDKDTVEFETDYPYYLSVKALLENKPWEQTPLYASGKLNLANGETAFGAKNEKELKEHSEKVLRLYNDIRQNGYRQPESNIFVPGTSDEISVHIGRHGEIIFHDGGHRLSIAKLLELDRVPAQVSVRHAEWDEFRRSLILQAKHSNGKLYQRVPHPDLEVIPFSHDCTDRMEMIKPHLDRCSGKLLDIGANWGMCSHYMENLGFDCVAIEIDASHAQFMEKIRNIFRKKFEIVRASVLDVDLSKYGKFEVMLALNIFHHFIKTKSMHEKLAVFLERIEANTIFFEPHNNEDFQDCNYYRNYDQEQFVDFVQSHSKLPNHKLIGRANGGRVIYKLW